MENVLDHLFQVLFWKSKAQSFSLYLTPFVTTTLISVTTSNQSYQITYLHLEAMEKNTTLYNKPAIACNFHK